MHLTVRDESGDAYTMRSFALYLADGTLFALYGQADPIIEKVAPSIMLLAIDVVFADIAATNISFGDANFLNPPATREMLGVVELATEAEAAALTDALRALTPKTLAAVFTAANILQRLLTVDGSGSGLDADLLDGQHGSYYANVPARLGFTPANRAGDTFTGNVSVVGGDLTACRADGATGAVFLGNSGTRYLYYDGTNYQFNGAQLAINNSLAWHAGNDGAGSGLDAGLFAGQLRGYYTNIIARLGFTPVNRSGDTMTGTLNIADGDLTVYRAGGTVGVVYLNQARTRYLYYDGSNYRLNGTGLTINDFQAWHAGNDGAGSGLDAGLFAGQLPGYYTDIVTRLGYTPVNAASPVMTNDAQIAKTGNVSLILNSLGVVISRLAAQADGNVVLYRSTGGPEEAIWYTTGGSFNINRPLLRQGQTVWDAANDGSGSGSDADMLDGHHASDFALMSGFGASLSGNGFTRLPNGLVLQWGSQSHTDASGTMLVNFPTPFPNTLLQAVVSNAGVGPPTAFHSVGERSTTGMNVNSARSSGVAAGVGTAVNWFAIGF
ncbi:gp53-like domain-containing protein [Sphingomonas sp.]|uniref:gp53-like domain-containing protein n=1 Tax=Sphingomonas sp. TaxID=28214 RepID=UPI003B3AD7F4